MSEVFGEVFAAPILTISNDEIRGQVEEELAQKEWQLKNKKKTANVKRSAAVANQAGDDVIPVEDEVWEIPSDDEQTREPLGKAPKKGDKKEEEQAMKDALKQEKLQESAWRKETAKATRVIASLTSVTQSLANAKVRTSNNAELFDDSVLNGITEAFTKLKDLKDRIMPDYPRFFLVQRCGRFILTTLIFVIWLRIPEVQNHFFEQEKMNSPHDFFRNV